MAELFHISWLYFQKCGSIIIFYALYCSNLEFPCERERERECEREIVREREG